MIEYYDYWKRYNCEPLSVAMHYDREQLKDYCERSLLASIARGKGIPEYGFAIPNEESLNAIISLHRPIVEIGAGTGYWTYLLRQHEIDVIAYDNWNREWEKSWTHVIEGDHTNLSKYSDRVLFCCWPDNYLHLAEEYYKGDTMIWIGEECTDIYNRDMWEIEKEVIIPKWDSIHDIMYILRRNDALSQCNM